MRTAPLSQAPVSQAAPASRAALAQARARLDAVAEAERLAAEGLPLRQADAQAAEAAAVGTRSLRRWRLACRGIAPEARLAALTDRPGRGRCGPLTGGQMRDCVKALIYAHGPHLTASHAVRVLQARHGEAPSLRAVQRWLRRWRAENAQTLAAVTDPDGHRSLYAPAFGKWTGSIAEPNALWELDSTKADVVCTDGRMAIVGALDVWSRRGRLLVVPVSRATAICALLRRCLIDWGVPRAVRTDGGKDYVSTHLRRVLQDLGIAHDICPPYTPEAKPHIERWLGTVARDLFAFLPGFIGHSVADRKRIEAHKSMAERRGEDLRETFHVDLTGAMSI